MRLRNPPRPIADSPFARQLRYAREFHRHSQGEAAVALGVNQQVLSGWERQGRRPRSSPELLAALASYLPHMEGEEWTEERIQGLFPTAPQRVFHRREDGAFSRAAPPGPERAQRRTK